MQIMNITLNGNPETVSEQITLDELTGQMDLSGKRYAVEVNEQLIPRSQHAEYKLQEADKVEIVQAIGGG